MAKMSVSDAAEYFGVSREAIHNRVRRGSLTSVVENGVKLVVIDKKAVPTRRVAKVNTSSSNDKYYKLLEEQNVKLQDKVEKLEGETRTLRDQKEQMLIDERNKVEQIYRDKDEQLKSILNTFQAQFILGAPEHEEEALEVEIEEEAEEEKKEVDRLGIISLKKYLKEQKLSDKKVQKIKQKFKKRAKKDERIISIGKKFYLNLDKYDYRDLF